MGWMGKFNFFLIFVFLLLVSCGLVSASNWYVSPSGTGTNQSANSPGAVAATISAANAGDTVYFENGTYPEATITMNHAGTAANPIYIKVYNGTATLSSAYYNTTAINLYYKDYIIIDGIQACGYRTGIMNFGSNTLLTNLSIHDIDRNLCLIDGASYATSAHAPLQNVTVQNSTFYNCGANGSTTYDMFSICGAKNNSTDIQMNNINIINNEIYGSCPHICFGVLSYTSGYNGYSYGLTGLNVTGNNVHDIPSVFLNSIYGQTDGLNMSQNTFTNMSKSVFDGDPTNSLINYNAFFNTSLQYAAILLRKTSFTVSPYNDSISYNSWTNCSSNFANISVSDAFSAINETGNNASNYSSTTPNGSIITDPVGNYNVTVTTNGLLSVRDSQCRISYFVHGSPWTANSINSTFCYPTYSESNITETAGGSSSSIATVNYYNYSVIPSTGYVNISTNSKTGPEQLNFTAIPSGSLSMQTTAWGLDAYATYNITCDGVYLQNVTADPDGYISFSDTISSTHTYAIIPTKLGADFTTDPNPAKGQYPLTVQFNDKSSGLPLTWNWDFGDGTANSTDENPLHTYSTAGLYSVTLTIYDGTVYSTKTYPNIVNVTTPRLNVLYVNVSGNNSSSGDIDHPIRDIDVAIKKAVAGDTIYVRGGTYYANVSFANATGYPLAWYNSTTTKTLTANGTANNPITIKPYPGENVTLDGKFSGAEAFLIHKHSYINIDGFTIKNYRIAIDLQDTTGDVISNCTVTRDNASNATGYPIIFMSNTSYSTLENCNIDNHSLGWNLLQIQAYWAGTGRETHDIKIDNCTIHDQHNHNGVNFAIEYDYPAHVQIFTKCIYNVTFTNNKIYNCDSLNSIGVATNWATVWDSLFANNTLYNDHQGMSVYSENCTFRNNTLYNISTCTLGSDDLRNSNSTFDSNNATLNSFAYNCTVINPLTIGYFLTNSQYYPPGKGNVVIPGNGSVVIKDFKYSPIDLNFASNISAEYLQSNNNYFSLVYKNGSTSYTSGNEIFYPSKSNQSINMTSSGGAWFTSKAYPISLKPTSGYLYNVTLNNYNVTTDMCNISATSSVVGTFNISATMKNTSSGYKLIKDGSAIRTTNATSYIASFSDIPIGTTNSIYTISSTNSVAPTANFSASPVSGNASLAVQFTDQSRGSPTSWLWNFGDGNTSTDQNPAHTYYTNGTYNVSLNASNDLGYNNLTVPNYIVVANPGRPIVANFVTNTTKVHIGDYIQFTDQSNGTGITTWLWSFGDGTTSTQQNTTHAYTNSGTYTVSLNASGGSNYENISKSGLITVLTNLTASFSKNVTNNSNPHPVNFTDSSTGSPISYSWDFGDGYTSTDRNASHTYSDNGTYTVTETVFDGVGYSTIHQTLILPAVLPTPLFFSNVTDGISPLSVYFRDISTNETSRTWTFGDGGTSTTKNLSYIYYGIGAYNVTLSATNENGTRSLTKYWYIYSARSQYDYQYRIWKILKQWGQI